MSGIRDQGLGIRGTLTHAACERPVETVEHTAQFVRFRKQWRDSRATFESQLSAQLKLRFSFGKASKRNANRNAGTPWSPAGVPRQCSTARTPQPSAIVRPSHTALPVASEQSGNRPGSRASFPISTLPADGMIESACHLHVQETAPTQFTPTTGTTARTIARSRAFLVSWRRSFCNA